MQLGLCVAAGAFQHGSDFAVIEPVNVVKDEDIAITGRKCCNCAINSESVNCASLHKVRRAETASNAFFGAARHHLVE